MIENQAKIRHLLNMISFNFEQNTLMKITRHKPINSQKLDSIKPIKHNETLLEQTQAEIRRKFFIDMPDIKQKLVRNQIFIR